MVLEPLQHNEVIPNPRTEAHFFRLQASVPMIDEDDLMCARLKYRCGRDDELPSQSGLQVDIHKHTRLEHEAGIIDRKSYLYGARRHIDLRQDLFDAAMKSTPGGSANGGD